MTLSDFSHEEQAVIEKLRSRTTDCVTPKMLEDNYLFYRFAKARDFDLAEAESMLRKHICWRKELKTDTMLTDYKPPEVLVKYVPTTHLGFDKEGCIVLFTDAGGLDWKGLWNCAKKQDIVQYLSYYVEQRKDELLKRNKKFGKQIFLTIFDLENLASATVTHMKSIQYCIYLLKAYADNFPEILKCVFVINAPFYFVWAFTVFKQVLPDTILKKIYIYRKEGWREELLKLIDADVLPAFLGGNKTDPDGDPQCKAFVKRGKPIPKCFYMANERKNLGADFQKLTILPFCKKEISFEVKEASSNLEWEYDIKSGDIDFSLHFRGKGLDSVELIPKHRAETSYETEKGFFKCEQVGMYIMVLDNSHSWIYTKEVSIKAGIKPSKDTRI